VRRILICTALVMAHLAAGNRLSGQTASSSAPGDRAIRFHSDIQPLLAARCLKCHGANEPEADLNLADRRSAYSVHDSGSPAVVPGQPDESELLRRVSAAADSGERMPPAGEGLSESEIELLRRWIAEGASWPRHWAYAELQRPAVPLPPAPLADWCRTPIDRFVAAQLVESGLAPSPDADRRTLLRRLYFDLIGLPPTPQQMDKFLADELPDAYERVVEQLLASPHYGERWARHWMDIVHFAETHGHDQDRPREHAWPYRDYLIRSLNADKPYARFVQEQVAGDILYPDDPWAIVATGMLAAGPWDESSLRDIREDSLDREIGRYLDRDDIVTTVMSTFVSTSVHCARCHDHKFDPIPQREYYALQAVFAGIDKANRIVDMDRHIAERRRELTEFQKQIPRWLAERSPELLREAVWNEVLTWENEIRSRLVSWTPVQIREVRSGGGATLTRQDDASVLSSGTRPDKDIYTLIAQAASPAIRGLRLEVLTDDSLPNKGPGWQDNGNLHLNEIRVWVAESPDATAWREVSLPQAKADFDQDGWTIAMAIDGNPNTAWGIHPQVGKPHEAVFQVQPPLVGEALVLRIELHQVHGQRHLLGRWRISTTDGENPLSDDALLPPAEVAGILRLAAADRDPRQRAQLAAYYLDWKTQRQLQQLPPPQNVYCGTNHFQPDGSFRPTSEPRTVHVLHRGMITEPQQPAEPGALSCLEHLPDGFSRADGQDEGRRRRELAVWLSHPENSLTWRSIANRVWQYHFGRGLVETANDFGQMGAAPSHPELLDWLASTLRDHGGSLKQLHRAIVTSAVYRQSSQHREQAARLDADNRWLWRMHRQRLDAESFRDALLVLSGTFDPAMGGPSVKHFLQSPGIHVTPNVDYQGYDVNGPGNFRRSVYRFIFRTMPDPFMDALDCPDASQLTPKRTVSVTALQAMATLNDKFVVRQSELLAASIAAETEHGDQQVAELYRRLFNRRPSPQEAELVRAYVERHGLANAGRFLLNTNEFLFVD
jgi:hypothetical protein